MKKWLTKNLALFIFAIGIYIISYIMYTYESERGLYIFTGIFIYLGTFIIASILPDNKFLTPIKNTIMLPGVIITIIGPLFQVLFFIFNSFILPYGIILIITYLIKTLFNLEISTSTITYLTLVFGTIYSTSYGDKKIERLNKNHNFDKSEERKKSQLDLTYSLINSGKIRIIIYVLFFIFLVIYSVVRLENKEIFNSKIDASIFYSFITFLAFERILSNFDLLKISPRKFINKLLKSWLLSFRN